MIYIYRTGVSILIHKFENDSTMQLKQGLSVVLYEQSTKCNPNMNTDASRYIDPTQMQVHTIWGGFHAPCRIGIFVYYFMPNKL